MTLFEYVNSMKESGSTVGLIGVGLLALFLVVIILKMLGGMRRGTWRQFIRTGMTLLAAVISYIAAEFLSNSIIGALKVEKMKDFIVLLDSKLPGIGEYLNQMLSSFDPKLFENLIILPATVVILPILATLLFLLINLILKVVRAIIIKIFRFKKAKNNSQRLGGALLAAVEAIIWVLMVTLPITGLISLAHNAYDATVNKERDGETSQFEEIYVEYLEPFVNNPAIDFINSLGAENMAESIATIKMNDQKVNMREETVFITKVVIEEAPNISEIDFSAPTEEHKVTINNLINGLCDSSYVSNIFVSLLQNTSSLMDMIGFVAGDDENMVALVNDIVSYFEGVTIESLHDDLDTIKNLYFTVTDSGIITEMQNGGSDLLTIIQEKHKAGDDVVNKLIKTLQANNRTADLVKSITKTLISSISTNIDLGNGTTVNVSYDSLKDGIGDVLSVKPENFETSEEYKEALTETLDTVLNDHGIELEQEAIDSVADYIDQSGLNAENFSDDQFTGVLLECFDAYMKFLETSNSEGEGGESLPEGEGSLPEGLPGGLPEDLEDLLGGNQ